MSHLILAKVVDIEGDAVTLCCDEDYEGEPGRRVSVRREFDRAVWLAEGSARYVRDALTKWLDGHGTEIAATTERDEAAQILEADGETIVEAARRVVADRDALARELRVRAGGAP